MVSEAETLSHRLELAIRAAERIIELVTETKRVIESEQREPKDGRDGGQEN
jgi:hypothetical protein